MKIFRFHFNSCTFESSYETISIHKTKKGAYKAMKTHKVDEYTSWYNDRLIFGKGGREFPYNFGKGWFIDESVLLE